MIHFRLSLFSLCFLPLAATAQGSTPPLSHILGPVVGAEVEATLRCGVVRGVLTDVTDSGVLRLSRARNGACAVDGSSMDLRVEQIRALRARTSTEARAGLRRGARLGGFAGLLMSGTLSLIQEDITVEEGVLVTALGTLGGALYGAAVGTLMGSLVPRWEPVPLPVAAHPGAAGPIGPLSFPNDDRLTAPARIR